MLQSHTCAICLEGVAPGGHAHTTPCRHVFHAACMGEWREHGGHRCPLCNADLPPPAPRAGGAGAGGEKRARGRGEAEAARQSSSCGLRRRNTAPCGAVADRAQRARRVRSARWAAAHMNLRPFSSLVGSLIVRGRCAASKNQHEDRPAKPDVSRSSRRRALITRLHGGQQHPAGVRHQGGGLGPRRAGARRIFLDLRRFSPTPFVPVAQVRPE